MLSTTGVQEQTIAIIDLGTNTFHLLLVDLQSNETFRIAEKFKEFVRLGEGGITDGRLTDEAFARGLAVLDKFNKLIEARGIVHVLAFATSAIRSAANGPEFVAEVRRQTGISVQVIPGNEEAALIYQGVRHGITLPAHESVLLVDIGGGSVEFVVADALRPKLLRSLEIGGARMLAQFPGADPLLPAQQAAIRAHYAAALTPLLAEIRALGVRRMVGSSGSYETLGGYIAYRQGNHLAEHNPHGYTFGVAALYPAIQTLVNTPREQRLRLPGVDASRVDMIPYGGLLVEYLAQELAIEEVTISGYALKEGILYDFLDRMRLGRPGLMGLGQQPRHRERTIRALGSKYGWNEPHVEQVARLARRLFVLTQPLHGYGERELEYLEYAALLHDIGHFVNHSGHHKHGQYIILNSNMPGFSTDEQALLANLVRYHRKSLPSKEHLHFNLLYRDDKVLVRRLAGLLRLADNLDRGKRGLVQDLGIELQGNALTLLVKAEEPVDLEIENAVMNRELFEEAFDLQVIIRQADILPADILPA
jgi:exopolyphosphatase/guanosine-5'-triphosphate,3'-diphosphate pyrophosphatase